MRRIQRDIKHEEFIKSLTTGDKAIFRDIWKVLLFAAAYGVYLGGRRPLHKVEGNKSMPESYFSTGGWRGFLYLIGFIENASSDHMRRDEEEENKLITAFEEYANFGLEEMQNKVTTPSSALPDLVEILLNSATRIKNDPEISDLI